jgi:hypothetical protein
MTIAKIRFSHEYLLFRSENHFHNDAADSSVVISPNVFNAFVSHNLLDQKFFETYGIRLTRRAQRKRPNVNKFTRKKCQILTHFSRGAGQSGRALHAPGSNLFSGVFFLLLKERKPITY